MGSYLNTAQLTCKFNAAASSSRANLDTCKVLWSPCEHCLLASNSITTHGPTPQGHIKSKDKVQSKSVVGDIHVADRVKKNRKPGLKSHVHTAHESNCNVWVHLTFNDVVPLRSRPPFRNGVTS